jgi:hypothetical protein
VHQPVVRQNAPAAVVVVLAVDVAAQEDVAVPVVVRRAALAEALVVPAAEAETVKVAGVKAAAVVKAATVVAAGVLRAMELRAKGEISSRT